MISPLRLSLLLVPVLAGVLHGADLQFASIFTDGAVIQRNQPIPVWGQGEPNTSVTIDFDQQHAQGTVGADGWWRVDLPAHGAGGPYTLSVAAAGKTMALKDMLCGDVWLCSGQSNMQMSVGECAGGERAAAEVVNYPRLRLFGVNRGGADQPQRTLGQSPAAAAWKAATPELVTHFSGVGYFFAQALLKDPALRDVPLGLIDSSVGGTAAEAWVPVEDQAWLTGPERCGPGYKIVPGGLYNAMIAPLVPAGLSGVLWYQGESNAGQPGAYARLLSSLMESWRKQWNRADLPFFIVQLPAFADKIGDHYFTWLREAQARAVQDTPHSALAVTLDTADGSTIHPRHKQELARRLALLARRDVYGETLVAQGPIFQGAEREGSHLVAKFDTGGSELASRVPGRVEGFQLAGADGVYFFADAELRGGNEVLVESKHVPEPKTLRYAWASVPTADLVNGDGLPAAPFRTDTLPPTDLEFQPLPVSHRLATKNIDLVVDERGNVRSLGVGGQQFLSNSFGGSGGTCFPGVFGFPRELSIEEKLQPGCLRYHDDVLSLQITADDEQTTWTITNGDSESHQFRMTLSNGVNASSKESGVVEMSRFLTRVRLEGITELQKPGFDGQPVMTTVPAHGTVVIRVVHQN